MNNIRILPSLIVFAEVAKRQSFTAAAKHLKMSKSAVSQHIQRLEQILGTQLLTRNTRAMALTGAGKRMLERSELLTGQLDTILLEAARTENAPTGVFSVTSPHSLEQEVLVPAVSQLVAEFPGIKPRLIVTDNALDLIHEKIDVSLFAGPLKDSSYRSLPLGKIHEIFCATPAYIQQFGEPRDINDLQNHRWISIPWQNNQIRTQAALENSTGTVATKMKPFARSNTLSGAIELAKQHMGIVLLPDIIAVPLIQKAIFLPVLTDHIHAPWPVHFVHPYQGKKPIHIERFHHLVKHYFGRIQLGS